MSRSSRIQSCSFIAWNVHRFAFIPFLFSSFYCLFVFCYWLLKLIFLFFFICTLRDFVLMLLRNRHNARPHFPFLDAYCLSILSLGRKAMYRVIIFSYSSHLSSFLVLFKNCPEYLTRRTAQMFIPLMRFLQQNFVLTSFLALLSNSFLIFLSSLLVWWCPLQFFLLFLIVLPKCYNGSLILRFYFFGCFCFPTFHYKQDTLFRAKFHYSTYIFLLFVSESPVCFHFLQISLCYSYT